MRAGGHRDCMRAKLVQQIFQVVSPIDEVLRAEKPGAALNRVEGAEDGSECFLVAGIFLEA